MMQLHQDYDKFVERDTVVIAVGPEEKEKFGEYWDKHEFLFYGIPDSEHTILKLYGQKVNLIKLGRMPAQFILDKNGILRYVHYGKSMKDIPENTEIFEFLDRMD